LRARKAVPFCKTLKIRLFKTKNAKTMKKGGEKVCKTIDTKGIE